MVDNEYSKLFPDEDSNIGFSNQVPPAVTQQQANISDQASVPNVPDANGVHPEGVFISNTLDEPVWKTISRDLARIGMNVKLVVLPFTGRSQQEAALKNWDLWGPLIFTLILAYMLSSGEKKQDTIFSVVFVTVALGAVVLTLNVQLLGGSIVFFQSLCLLGYCLVPILAATIIGSFFHITWLHIVINVLAMAWAFWAAVPFIGGSVDQSRRALAVYPVLLLYTSLAWFGIVK